MKKIFYSMMAVALCACSQSEVDDMPTPPQPENNGLTFTVVDNGFIGEDGTRVTYGEYGSADKGAYKATFEKNDVIGIYAIKSAATDGTNYTVDAPYTHTDDAAYTVKNAKLTLTDSGWKLTDADGNANVDFGDADLLLAYAPYRPDANLNNKPSFIGTKGNWDINTKDNRFFVWPFTVKDNSTLDAFKKADWMGAAVNLKSDTKTITLNMKHMRGMVELTTNKDVELTELKLSYSDGKFEPYLFATTETQKVYRIVTTEYRTGFTVTATIKDLNIVKKYEKTVAAKLAGTCSHMNIEYTPVPSITVTSENSLAKQLGDTQPESLRLTGTLSETDWTTLRSLTALKTLDMYNLTNKSIPNDWMKNSTKLKETLTTLVLPSGLTTIGSDALQVKNVGNIDIPATVTEIGTGAFYWNTKTTMRIPEGSQLATVGNGAFYNTKAVYTYDNNYNELVLPETLTSIGTDGAFNAVNQLRKVVFKRETAPTIDNTGKIDVFDNNAVIYVPNTTYKQTPGLFPGNTVIVAGPTLTVDNYKSDYTHIGEGSLSHLCDGKNDTYWHSNYSSTAAGDETYGQYIEITLPDGETMSSLVMEYVTRHDSDTGTPAAIDIYTSADGGATWDKLFTLTKDVDKLPQTKGTTYTTEMKTATTPFTKIRFAITASKGGSLLGKIATDSNGYAVASTALAELSIYADKWTEQ